MKRIFILLCITVTTFCAVRAQDDTGNKTDVGRLQAYKIAFLTKRLNLSPEEAQKFWPIYNRYQDEIRTARQDNRKNNNEIANEEKMLNIRKKYSQEFTKALSAEKINNLFRSEKEFGNMVQKELRERRQQKLDNRKRKQ